MSSEKPFHIPFISGLSTSLGWRDLALTGCFFASGFAGLSYEICWIRTSSLVFGSTTFAMSTVTAVFFAGLAVGSYLFGRYSRKLRRPLTTYALLEIILGALAMLSPLMFSRAESLYRFFYPSLTGSFALLTLTRGLLVAAVILPPTILMGATLPLFCRHYVVRRDRISLPVGLLYGLNTFGAALGSAVSGFFLIPTLGVTKTILTTGILNMAIGVGAFGVQRATSPSDVSVVETFTAPEGKGRDTVILSGLFFLAGFVALANEILWVRFLSLLIHNTVYTYTFILTVTLSGIVAGSFLISFFGDRTSRRAFIFGSVHALTAITVWTLVMLPAQWWQSMADTQDAPGQSWLILVLLLSVPAILSGVSFPLAVRMAVVCPSLAGSGVGKMSAINTCGGIAGSLLAGFVLLPQVGLQTSLLVTTGLSLGIACTAWLLLERTLMPLTRAAVTLCAALLWAAIPFLTGTRLPLDYLRNRQGQVIDFREGHGSLLTVLRSDKKREEFILEIDRLWQGSSLKTHQIMAAHVPMMFQPAPGRVLVIGVGVGQTAERFLVYDVEQVDCVDIEAALFDIVRKNFASSWMTDPRVRLIVEDGRNYLSNTDTTYDLVSLEVGQSFRPGIASFYTYDFYRHVRKCLTRDGLVSQFVPINFLNLDEFRSLVRSFIEAFPASIIWYNTSELLLIGKASGHLELSGDRLSQLSRSGPVRSDLFYTHWGGADFYQNRLETFLAGFLCGPDKLAELSGQAAVYRDDLPRLEYSAASTSGKMPLFIVDTLAYYLDSPDLIMKTPLDAATLSRVRAIRDWNLNDIRVKYLLKLGTNHVEKHNIPLLKTALDMNPNNVQVRSMLVEALLLTGKPQEAQKHIDELMRIDPDGRISFEFGRVD